MLPGKGPEKKKERMNTMENSTTNRVQEQQENSQAPQATAQGATNPVGGERQDGGTGGNYFLGKTCRDIVSGFEGICIGIAEWMYGCRQMIVKPRVDSEGKRGAATYLFEKQLEVVDEGITGKVEVPEYTPPQFFGKECRDKVTGVVGMCVGRSIWLFNTDQYVLEIQPEDHAKDSRLMWLDPRLHPKCIFPGLCVQGCIPKCNLTMVASEK